MKLSDFVGKFLEENQVGACFMVSGGAVLHILDSIDRNTSIPIICSQHEQAAASGADTYSRTSKEKIGLVVATSGPGATNLTTGISNAYFDSVPLICITGQVSTFRSKPNKHIRQYGFQETDVVNIFKPITKLAIKVNSAKDIKFVLEKALFIALEGRPGPVLIDIPDDLQRAEIEPSRLRTYQKKSKFPKGKIINTTIEKKLNKYVKNANKPLLILGGGIRISQSESIAIDFIEKLNIPFVTTWAAKDIFPSHHKLNIGSFGVCGPRAGNWAVAESDLIVVLGARLNQMQVGGKLEEFGPSAKKIMIDLDKSEINKFKSTGLKVDYPLCLDLKTFFDSASILPRESGSWDQWLAKIKGDYEIINEHKNDKFEINAYQFIDELSALVNDNAIVITDAGGNLCWTMQGFKIKQNQRLISAWNHSPMGFSLPAAIGASFANPGSRISCIIGDGGLMMCLEELGTVSRHQLPIDIFIFNNRGHGIQKQTINTWLEGNMVGVDHDSGLFFPSFEKISLGFGIEYIEISELKYFREAYNVKRNGPRIFDVLVNPDQTISPMLKFGGSLKNLDASIQMPSFNF